MKTSYDQTINLFNTTNIQHSNDNNSIISMINESLLVQSTRLAREGKYSEAQRLLKEVKGGATPAFLDLLARINAQQGRLAEAEKLWMEASEMDPTNESYRRGLQLIAKMQSRPVWMSYLTPFITGFVLLLCVVIIGFAMKEYFDNQHKSIMAEIANINSVQKNKNMALAKLGIPSDAIKVPGTSVIATGDEITIMFDMGLFSSKTILKPEAKTLLTTLGQKLEPYAGQISIKVVGCTDNVPIPTGSAYIDNIALGMRRATVVVDHLRKTTTFPYKTFLVSSVGENSLYNNNPNTSKYRNRSVIIKISELIR